MWPEICYDRAMNKRITIELPEAALLHAEERAAEEGFDSVDAYLSALIEEDCAIDLNQEWIRKKIEEGLASPIVGELTRADIDRLMEEGIALANRRK